jgi:hypothetical protein
MTLGKSRAKIYVETDTKVTFKDVAGALPMKIPISHAPCRHRDRSGGLIKGLDCPPIRVGPVRWAWAVTRAAEGSRRNLP